MTDLRRTAIGCLIGLALFSLVFSLLAERDLWPRLPPGAFHDADLVAGFAGGFLLLVLMAWRRAAAESAPSAGEVGQALAGGAKGGRPAGLY